MARERAAGSGALLNASLQWCLLRQPLHSCMSWHFAFAGCIYEQHQQARHAATTAVVLRRYHLTPKLY